MFNAIVPRRTAFSTHRRPRELSFSVADSDEEIKQGRLKSKQCKAFHRVARSQLMFIGTPETMKQQLELSKSI